MKVRPEFFYFLDFSCQFRYDLLDSEIKNSFYSEFLQEYLVIFEI